MLLAVTNAVCDTFKIIQKYQKNLRGKQLFPKVAPVNCCTRHYSCVQKQVVNMMESNKSHKKNSLQQSFSPLNTLQTLYKDQQLHGTVCSI